jgi:hypothetical protein
VFDLFDIHWHLDDQWQLRLKPMEIQAFHNPKQLGYAVEAR